MDDRSLMAKALKLAKKSRGLTSSTPLVGALLVRKGEILAEGSLGRDGGAHAEISALKRARSTPRGATLYVNMEPCCRNDDGPACTTAIVDNRLKRVVVGTVDPRAEVNGKSIRILKKAGVDVELGVLAERCRHLNQIYLKYARTALPFVTLKFAQSIDGRIATSTGESRWISSPSSLRLAHRLRSFHDGVLVGIGTVLRDDPSLTVRLTRGNSPCRIVLDSNLRIPLKAKVLSDKQASRTIIATTRGADKKKAEAVTRLGANVLKVGTDPQGRVKLSSLLRKLAAMGIASIMVEGGSQIITSLLKEGLVDRIMVAVAPKIIGKGIDAIGDLGTTDINLALPLSWQRPKKVGDDILVEGTFRYE